MLKSIIFDGIKFYISKMHSNMVIFVHPEIATGKKNSHMINESPSFYFGTF